MKFIKRILGAWSRRWTFVRGSREPGAGGKRCRISNTEKYTWYTFLKDPISRLGLKGTLYCIIDSVALDPPPLICM